jgi:hypothetical protein
MKRREPKEKKKTKEEVFFASPLFGRGTLSKNPCLCSGSTSFERRRIETLIRPFFYADTPINLLNLKFIKFRGVKVGKWKRTKKKPPIYHYKSLPFYIYENKAHHPRA